jgi:hypothetical protein
VSQLSCCCLQVSSFTLHPAVMAEVFHMHLEGPLAHIAPELNGSIRDISYFMAANGMPRCSPHTVVNL